MKMTQKGSLFQRGKWWYLQFRINGKAFVKTLKTDNKEQAEREQENIMDIIHLTLHEGFEITNKIVREIPVESTRGGCLIKRREIWYFNFVIDKQKYLISLKTKDKVEAEEKRIQILKTVSKEKTKEKRKVALNKLRDLLNPVAFHENKSKAYNKKLNKIIKKQSIYNVPEGWINKFKDLDKLLESVKKIAKKLIKNWLNLLVSSIL